MPKVIRHKFQKSDATASALPPGTFEPIVIDLSQRRASPKPFFLRIGFLVNAALASLFIVSAVSFFMVSAQTTKLQKTESDTYFIPANDEPSLPPIPKAALSPKVVSLIPILKRLPVGEAKPEKTAFSGLGFNGMGNFSIAVNRDPKQAQFERLITAAAQEASSNHNESAIKLYTAALRLHPNDSDTAYNLVALLLQKAAFFDSREAWNDAAAVYENALKIWNENDEMAETIRARLDWIHKKQAAHIPGTNVSTANK